MHITFLPKPSKYVNFSLVRGCESMVTSSNRESVLLNHKEIRTKPRSKFCGLRSTQQYDKMNYAIAHNHKRMIPRPPFLFDFFLIYLSGSFKGANYIIQRKLLMSNLKTKSRGRRNVNLLGRSYGAGWVNKAFCETPAFTSRPFTQPIQDCLEFLSTSPSCLACCRHKLTEL